MQKRTFCTAHWLSANYHCFKPIDLTISQTYLFRICIKSVAYKEESSDLRHQANVSYPNTVISNSSALDLKSERGCVLRNTHNQNTDLLTQRWLSESKQKWRSFISYKVSTTPQDASVIVTIHRLTLPIHLLTRWSQNHLYLLQQAHLQYELKNLRNTLRWCGCSTYVGWRSTVAESDVCVRGLNIVRLTGNGTAANLI